MDPDTRASSASVPSEEISWNIGDITYPQAAPAQPERALGEMFNLFL